MRILAIILFSLSLLSCEPIGHIGDFDSDDSSPEAELGIKSMEEIMEAEGIFRTLDFPTILKKDLIKIEGDSLSLGKVYATHDGTSTFLVELETASKQHAIRNIAKINTQSVARPEGENDWVYFPITTSRQWDETADDLTRPTRSSKSPTIYTGDFYVPGDTLKVGIRKVYSDTRIGVRTKHFLYNGEIVISKSILADGREVEISVENINGETNVTLQLPGGERRKVDVQTSLQ